ncbi:hypothetical protein G4B88_010817 [Cannabis sativa]|uniref:Protein kinase domain-containing protein n=1 Tax=Cannabis sativa TaxID=3483 RepID=A0A7J6HJA8_CANSA|nr:hypothetical protein G4B88_010817 [Cannabis sativa]
MTNSFTQKLGQGGFGDIYKGNLNDGSLVVVKVLNKSKGKDSEDFMNEVATISRTSHVNIVTLLGFCFELVEAASSDSYYESCIVPKTCGNQTITFPFFIQNQQQPYCGYPGFNLTCDSRGRSIINLFYQNHSIIVSNAAFWDLDKDQNSCLPSLRSLTDFSHGFKIADANGDRNSVVLLYNCQSSSTTMKNRIGYYEENRTNSVLAFYESEEDELAKALRMCVAGPTGDVVAVKTVAGLVVKNNELGRVVRMRDVVRNGFLVE